MDTTILKKAIVLALFFFCLYGCKSQSAIVVDIGAIEDKLLKAKIDGNTRKLLSEVNHAFVHKTVPTLTGIEMSDEAKSNVFALWETSPFRSRDPEIYENILNLKKGGYELRNIMLYVSKADSTERNQEGVIVFKQNGIIDDFYFSIGTSIYNGVMAEGKDVADLKCRETILSFIENLRTSYYRKDLDFLKKVFSESYYEKERARNMFMKGGLPREIILYLKQTKSEYMTHMQQLFAAKDYINIQFDDLKVVRHPKYPNYYGVAFKQQWHTAKYNDENYISFLIDFSKEDAPWIVVSTIQPRFLNGKEIDKSELFNITIHNWDK